VSQQTEFDTPLCRFGKAAIGAAAFAEYKWNGTQSDAVTVYMNQNQSSDPGSVCSENGGSDVSATDSNGRTWALCAFSDGSVIETNTLARGTASAANSALNRALKN
jgi:putative hemolysin